MAGKEIAGKVYIMVFVPHNRQSIRLQWYDYSFNGIYFITICTNHRKHYFGDIVDHKMHSSNAGSIAEKYCLEIPDHFPFVILHEFVVIPNHIHGLLEIDNNMTGNNDLCPLHVVRRHNGHYCHDDRYRRMDVAMRGRDVAMQRPYVGKNKHANTNEYNVNHEHMSKISPKPKSIPVIIRSYKSICAKMINIENKNVRFKWQGRYYDHIVRNKFSFDRIRKYIIENPIKWKNDRNNVW